MHLAARHAHGVGGAGSHRAGARPVRRLHPRHVLGGVHDEELAPPQVGRLVHGFLRDPRSQCGTSIHSFAFRRATR